MANVINLQFSDTVDSEQERFIYTGDETDNTDITWFIGTEGLSTSYTNVFTSGEVTGEPSTDAQSWDRDNNNANTTDSQHDWQLANHTVLLETLVIWHFQNSTIPQNYEVQAFNERVNDYVVVGSFTSNLGPNTKWVLNLDMDFFSDDFRLVRVTGSQATQLREIYMYGHLRRKDGDSVGLVTPPTIFEDLSDSKLNSSSLNDGWVNYENAIKIDYRRAYVSDPITLSGNYTINDNLETLVWVLDPNGSNRDVILPQTPELDHYVRIINSDGNNSLFIKETSGGPTIVELSNSSTILIGEFIWEQTDSIWHATY